MNKSAIKSFAVSARVKFIEAIKQKAYVLGITENEIKEPEIFEDGFRINDRFFKKYEIDQRKKLVGKIKGKGYEQVIEEVAYTWFNRFIALRFMEVNEYLPTGVRVLSSVDPNKSEPDIIKEASDIDFEDLNLELIYKLQDDNDIEGLYKYLLIKQCNELGKIMPVMFERIADYTELLLPDNLLQEGSIIRDLVENIDEEDWKEQVEIIGWLYQYYISEKKDEVFAALKKNKKITKENIPAATQLFTPDWIVKYMVENSLGRLWLESHPDEELQSKWKYYLEEAEQELEVQKQLEEIRNKDINPEEIKVLDPSMGSGHILVYAFDVLYEIYKAAGYSERDIPKLILEKNLYGLDIDDRAGQLAYFALMMKARSYNRRIFRKPLKLNVYSIQESNGISKEAIDYFANGDESLRNDVKYLVEVFNDAKEYGSILDVEKIDFEAIERRVEEIKDGETLDLFELQYKNIVLEKIPVLVEQGKIMSDKYDVICTNPPYMGSKGMNSQLTKFLKEKFQNSKNDLFAVFMELDKYYLKKNGFFAMINQHSWMFLSGYENLRNKIINNKEIYSMVHLGSHAFEEIGGEVVQSTAYILRDVNIEKYYGNYIRLIDYNNAKQKEVKFLESVQNPLCGYLYITTTRNFTKISGSPIAYWISNNLRDIFVNNKSLREIAKPRKGLDTADNNRFIRAWYEVNKHKIGFNYEDRHTTKESGLKWFPLNSGGQYRKWYGNFEKIINWENDGFEIKNFERAYVRNQDFYFKEGLSWTKISSSRLGVRYAPKGLIFDSAGQTLFPKNEDIKYILGFLCTKIAYNIAKILNPTLNFQVGDFERMPLKFNNIYKDKVTKLVDNSISISKIDWDCFETSWDFKKHPILLIHNEEKLNLQEIAIDSSIDLPIKSKSTLKEAYEKWEMVAENRFNHLKSNEEEINRIFIDIYGLQDELRPEVEEKDVSIRKADRERDIKSLISYAVGCMFGRYSLDYEEGLTYAGGEFNDKWRIESGELRVNTAEGWKKSSIDVTMDNVIPILDDEYFENDIVGRFVEFVKVTFGKDTLEENLKYIAETLGIKGSETSRQTIRRYFLKDFYKDHVKMYQKRPIYWLFDSGKQNGFKALIYMHRYNPSTVSVVRTDYLHKLQKKYEAEMNRLDIVMDTNVSQREKSAARKKKENINKQMLECMQYDQVVAHIANQKIDIDLDDGVKVNYEKFQNVEIPQGEGKKLLKANLLAKI